MKRLILVLGVIISMGTGYKTIEASTSDVSISSEFLDEESGVYIIPSANAGSFYESRALASTKFSGTATHQIDVISPSFRAPQFVQVTFNYESPQKYDIKFSYTLQVYSTSKGWTDVDSRNLVATSKTKRFASDFYYFSNKTGPYRVIIRTGDARGVKIIDGKVSSYSEIPK